MSRPWGCALCCFFLLGPDDLCTLMACLKHHLLCLVLTSIVQPVWSLPVHNLFLSLALCASSLPTRFLEERDKLVGSVFSFNLVPGFTLGVWVNHAFIIQSQIIVMEFSFRCWADSWGLLFGWDVAQMERHTILLCSFCCRPVTQLWSHDSILDSLWIQSSSWNFPWLFTLPLAFLDEYYRNEILSLPASNSWIFHCTWDKV